LPRPRRRFVGRGGYDRGKLGRRVLAAGTPRRKPDASAFNATRCLPQPALRIKFGHPAAACRCLEDCIGNFAMRGVGRSAPSCRETRPAFPAAPTSPVISSSDHFQTAAHCRRDRARAVSGYLAKRRPRESPSATAHCPASPGFHQPRTDDSSPAPTPARDPRPDQGTAAKHQRLATSSSVESAANRHCAHVFAPNPRPHREH